MAAALATAVVGTRQHLSRTLWSGSVSWRGALPVAGLRLLPLELPASSPAAGKRLGFSSLEVVPSARFDEPGLEPHRKRNVPPLIFEKEIMLFQSTVNIQEIAAGARQRCLAGAGLAAIGFTTLIVSVGPVLPPPVVAMLLGVAAANSYVLALVSQRLIRRLAAQHVDMIAILPTPAEARRIIEEEQRKQEEEDDSLSKLLAASATFEERLSATPILRLQVRTASADRWLSLVNPPEDQPELEEVDDRSHRASFADLCGRIRLLQVCLEHGVCHDHAMLTAICSSVKVADDELAEPRSDAGPALQVSPGAPPPGRWLSEVTAAEVEKGEDVVTKQFAFEAINVIGRRAILGGASVLLGSFLFHVGERARDADGVPRWKNLALPF